MTTKPFFKPVPEDKINEWIKKSKIKINNGYSRLRIISSQGGISTIKITAPFSEDIWETLGGSLAMGIAYYVILK